MLLLLLLSSRLPRLLLLQGRMAWLAALQLPLLLLPLSLLPPLSRGAEAGQGLTAACCWAATALLQRLLQRLPAGTSARELMQLLLSLRLELLPLLLLVSLPGACSKLLACATCCSEPAAVLRLNIWQSSALCSLAMLLPQRLLPAALADWGLAGLQAALLACWLLAAEAGRERCWRCTSELASAADSRASADSTVTCCSAVSGVA